MWFLMKGMFWFSIVLLTLPIIDDRPDAAEAAGPEVEFAATLNAIGVAFNDIRALCERHPDVCVTGSETLTALGLRARDGARVAYQYLDSTLAEDGGDGAGQDIARSEPAVSLEAAADPQSTGTVPADLERLAAAAALKAALSAQAADTGQ